MKSLILTLFILLGLSNLAQADPYKDAMTGLCEKMKSCAIAEMQKESAGLSDAMKEMIKGQMQAMCAGMEQEFSQAAMVPDLKDEVMACVQSIQAQSCAALMSENDDGSTPQCDALEKKAETMGGN